MLYYCQISLYIPIYCNFRQWRVEHFFGVRPNTFLFLLPPPPLQLTTNIVPSYKKLNKIFLRIIFKDVSKCINFKSIRITRNI